MLLSCTLWMVTAATLPNAGPPPLSTKEPPKSTLSPLVHKPLIEALTLSYDELFDQAATLEFSQHQLDRMREFFKESESYCTSNFGMEAKRLDHEIRDAQSELDRRGHSLSDSERKEIHCRIQTARLLEARAKMLSKHAVPVAYQNRRAKLEIIEKWPAELTHIKESIRTGEYANRKYGNVKDIGFRDIAPGQEKDVKMGRETIEEMKMAGMFPREIDDREIQAYVLDLASRIAAKSDLRVPLKTTLLDSPEINAFALPGGYLYVQRGLLEAVEDEAQLAGVLAHELSHVTARHGHKLMRKATIASIIYQAAQVTAIILTGGVAGIGTYYAIQYGFYGLGLVLSLDLLGVSRDYELEADQLGVQYMWNAGYDPSGFTRFFDRMATKEGYANGVSWFRTHPPFYDRMVHTRREIMYLPAKDATIRTTTRFDEMKKRLGPVAARAKEIESRKPTLTLPEKDCPKPKLPEYEPGQRIETVCSIPEP
ncbi:MAG: M48 family metalloprotease [Bryobacteraceae bacterium]